MESGKYAQKMMGFPQEIHHHIMASLCSHLNAFLDAVVEDEEDEDALAGEHKVVPDRHITDQLDGTEGPGWDGATSGRELNEQPGKTQRLNYMYSISLSITYFYILSLIHFYEYIIVFILFLKSLFFKFASNI